MILSTINNGSSNKSLDNIIANVLQLNLSELPEGLLEIEGKNVLVNRVKGQARTLDESMTEIHKDYIDVHLILLGQETLGYSLKLANKEFMNFMAFENDCELQNLVDEEQFVTLNAEQYCVFFPGEWHRPMITSNCNANIIEKVVIKIKASFL